MPKSEKNHHLYPLPDKDWVAGHWARFHGTMRIIVALPLPSPSTPSTVFISLVRRSLMPLLQDHSRVTDHALRAASIISRVACPKQEPRH